MDITNYIKENEPSADEIVNLLEQLKESCRLLTEDASNDMMEDAAVFTLRMFLDHDIVMLKHLSQLKQMFGNVVSSTANKICQVNIIRL